MNGHTHRDLEELLDRVAERFVDKVVSRMAGQPTQNGHRNGNSGKRRDMRRDMRCRVKGCGERSRGPRFRFMCQKHSALPKKEQLEALAAFKEAQRN